MPSETTMSPDEYSEYDAVGLAGLVHRGEVTPEALTRAAIRKIDSLNEVLNAVVERCDGDALAASSSIDTRAPLAGVPFLAKDMYIEVAGLHLTSSCRWLAGLPRATRDAPLAARWRDAGLSILGRTNTPEFAGEFVTEPTWRGPTRNPWNLASSPGGSSGGAAAAVAAGMVPIAHGTDSGGSIRVPAAACGLVGLKPSRGLVACGPHFDELAGGLDCEHVLARTMRDSAVVLDLTAGAEPTSRTLPRLPPAPFASALNAPLPPLRIGMTLTAPGGIRCSEEIAKAVDSVAAVLARAGHQVQEFVFPASASIGEPAGVLWLSAIAEEIDFYLERVGRAPQADELEALTSAGIALGKRRSAVDYVRARRALTAATGDMSAAASRLDVLLLPTTASLPPLIGEIDGRTAAFDLDRWNAESYGYAPYTEIFNVTGQPAISLPLTESRDGSPIGIQLAAPLGQDSLLISLGAWLEREMPWSDRLSALRRRFRVD
jgi:amidase